MCIDEGTWFLRSPLSHNVLTANLSMQYTNHCIRAMVIVKPKKAAIEDKKVCAVSGHKNFLSLSLYSRTKTKEVHWMFDVADGKVPLELPVIEIGK